MTDNKDDSDQEDSNNFLSKTGTYARGQAYKGYKYSAGQIDRKIVGLMFITVLFSVIGEEIKVSQDPTKDAGTGVFTGPVKVLVGGVAATVVLSIMSEFGETAGEFAQGLAMVAALSALLIQGGPVWKRLNDVLGDSQASSGAKRNTKTSKAPSTSAPSAPSTQRPTGRISGLEGN